jgi:hypothetical protein
MSDKVIGNRPVPYLFGTEQSYALADARYTKRENNLSDLSNKPAALLNLGAHQIFHVRDEKAGNVDGGASVVGWQTRVLNTTVLNTITGASLASNQVTLPEGTYDIVAKAPAFAVDGNMVRVRTTGGVTLAKSQMNYCTAASTPGMVATAEGRFTLASATIIELQHYCQTARAGNGLGSSTPVAAGENAVFGELIIKRVA